MVLSLEFLDPLQPLGAEAYVVHRVTIPTWLHRPISQPPRVRMVHVLEHHEWLLGTALDPQSLGHARDKVPHTHRPVSSPSLWMCLLEDHPDGQDEPVHPVALDREETPEDVALANGRRELLRHRRRGWRGLLLVLDLHLGRGQLGQHVHGLLDLLLDLLGRLVLQVRDERDQIPRELENVLSIGTVRVLAHREDQLVLLQGFQEQVPLILVDEHEPGRDPQSHRPVHVRHLTLEKDLELGEHVAVNALLELDELLLETKGQILNLQRLDLLESHGRLLRRDRLLRRGRLLSLLWLPLDLPFRLLEELEKVVGLDPIGCRDIDDPTRPVIAGLGLHLDLPSLFAYDANADEAPAVGRSLDRRPEGCRHFVDDVCLL